MRCLQSEQATADHHCRTALLCGQQQLFHIVQIAERHHPAQILAGDRDDERF